MEAMDSVAGDRVLGMRVRRMGDAVRTEISDRGQGIDQPLFPVSVPGTGADSLLDEAGGTGAVADGADFVLVTLAGLVPAAA